MAVTNEQVLAAISEYRAENGRPCPAKYLAEKLGDEALDVVAALKKDGTLVGKRGRTGGLVPSGEVAAPADAAEDTAAGDGESVADQFAALAAKLAEGSADGESAVG